MKTNKKCILLLRIAIGMGFIFVRLVRLLLALYQSSVEFFLGVNGCQVDRHRKLFLRGLQGTVFSLFFTAVACGVETNASGSPAKGPLGVVWEAAIEETGSYEQAVSVLFEQFEEVTDSRLFR